MLGWEFPPVSRGGLGRACHGLVTSLAKKGTDITFVVPVFPHTKKDGNVKIISAFGIGKVKIKEVISGLNPYETDEEYRSRLEYKGGNTRSLYGRSLWAEVERFTRNAALIAMEEDFDIIHAHDWMAFEAGIRAKQISGKPLVVQVHSTELDRTGGNGANQMVYDVERRGMHMADRVITVSKMEKERIKCHYGVPEEKINVVYNAINPYEHINLSRGLNMKNHKMVLFLGRVTIQKGPDYFIDAAKMVLDKNPDAIFVVAGSGDMTSRLIEQASHLGISDRVFFTGYISDEEIQKLMKSASVLVMPSISEPFGIVALEAMLNRVPLIVSKQSGVVEVVNNCMKVDFWDVQEMANKILATLEYDPLYDSLSENGYMDVYNMSWDYPAESCKGIYQTMLGVV